MTKLGQCIKHKWMQEIKKYYKVRWRKICKHCILNTIIISIITHLIKDSVSTWLAIASSRARINSWIELELIINSIQFSMNWIGIELKDFELEFNWNWKPELIRIDQFNQFIFNSTQHFTRLAFFLWHIMQIAVWQAMAAMIKQAYPHAPCSSMGSAEVFGPEGLTISSITLRYYQWFNSLSLSDQQIW